MVSRGKCLWSTAGGEVEALRLAVQLVEERTWESNPTVNLFLYSPSVCFALCLSPTCQCWGCLQVLIVSCVLWHHFPPFFMVSPALLVTCPLPLVFHFLKTCWNLFSLPPPFSPCVHSFYSFIDILIEFQEGKKHTVVVNLPCLIGNLRRWYYIFVLLVSIRVL